MKTGKYQKFVMYGYTQEEMDCCRSQISAANMRIADVFSGIAGVFFIALSILSPFIPSYRSQFWVFLIPAVLNIILQILLNKVPFFKEKPIYGAYLVMFVLTAYSVLYTSTVPMERSVDFPVMIAITIIIFIDRADRMFVAAVLNVVAFVAAILNVKNPAIYEEEIFSALIYAMLALIIHYVFTKRRIKGMLGVYHAECYIEELRKAQISLHEQAYYDGLTGLLTRSAFIEESQKISESEKANTYFCIIDMDYLKKINDNFGHQYGDQAIIRLAELIRDVLKTRSIIEDQWDEAEKSPNVAGRLGGDEFVAYITNCDSEHEIRERLEELEQQMKRVEIPTGNSLSVSIGFVTVPEQKLDFDEIYHQADEALYEAKRAGRGRVCSYRPS